MRRAIERRAQRVVRRVAGVGVLVASLGSRAARADVTAPARATSGTTSDAPKRVTITVVSAEDSLPTFEQRVSSWFVDGTVVTVAWTAKLDPTELLTANSEEIRVWVVPLSQERALVTFSSADQPASARHLVRDVPLPNGLDDLGLERLASVIHTASVALREGADGLALAHAARELSAAGLTGAAREDARPTPAPAPAPALRIYSPEDTPARVAPEETAGARRAELLIGAGYGGRLRGSEGPGHGPTVGVGVRLPGQLRAASLLLSAQLLFRSRFDAGSIDASVQTTALRAFAGIEPELAPSLSLAVLVGGGVDLAQIRPIREAESEVEPRAGGAQWRGAGELSGGLWWRTRALDLGMLVHTTILLSDVHYGIRTSQGAQRLAAPWSVQPGLSLQGRFRSGW